jgi:hypothetical protein
MDVRLKPDTMVGTVRLKPDTTRGIGEVLVFVCWTLSSAVFLHTRRIAHGELQAARVLSEAEGAGA